MMNIPDTLCAILDIPSLACRLSLFCACSRKPVAWPRSLARFIGLGMEGTPQHPRSNPLRTRHARVDGRPSARKAYASENDVTALEGSRHRGAPRTPRKPTSGPTLPPGSGSNKPASNPRNRNRNRAKSKNAPISPDVAHLNRQTSPYRPVSMRPSTSTAFAGATFHASPAPSALPIPSFLAKPSTDTPIHDDSGNTLQELSPLAIDTDASTPFRASSLPKPQGSPLDFMFRANLKEKARHSLGGQASKCADFSETTSPPPPLLAKPASPSLAHLSEAHHQPETASPSRLGQRKPKEGQGFAIGPAFSTPYHERIKAATLDTAQARPDQAKAEGPSEQRTAPVEDPAEALKKYLLAGSSNHGQARHESAVAPPADVSAGAASYVPQARIAESSPPGIPRPHDIQVMENDLRRILRMNLASES